MNLLLPLCPTALNTPTPTHPHPENLLVATHTRALLVYRASALCWAARAELQPVALAVAELPGLRGALVALEDTGRLAVCYMGTDPLTNPVGFTEVRGAGWRGVRAGQRGGRREGEGGGRKGREERCGTVARWGRRGGELEEQGSLRFRNGARWSPARGTHSHSKSCQPRETLCATSAVLQPPCHTLT